MKVQQPFRLRAVRLRQKILQNPATCLEFLRFGLQLKCNLRSAFLAPVPCGCVSKVFRRAKASCGFARNLRKDMFYQIQSYSFENIDRFSSSSLVTRLTTDITNVQMAYMMIIRIAVRSPLMLLFSFIMAFIMGGRMALIFLIVAPLLGIGLFTIIRMVMPLFRRVFKKYDALNNSVQENIQGMRVVNLSARTWLIGDMTATS